MSTELAKAAQLNDSKARQVFDAMDITESTRRDYQYRIGMFVDFLQEKGFHLNSFMEYKRFLGNRIDYSISTKNKYLAAARIFLKELSRQGAIPSDITLNIKSFQQEKKHKRDGLTEGEIQKITEYLNGAELNTKNVRNKAIVALFALQGLRQCEVMRLDVEDLELNTDKPKARIQGKGRDDKETVYLQPVTAMLLKSYLRQCNIRSGALFVSTSNNSKNDRLTTKTIRLLMKEIMKQLGIEKTTHGFRHYFTTMLIKSYKGDLTMVQRYTRHKSIEMLQVYNDNINHEADLPRFFQTFSGININV